jgi:type I restriction enzyme M protein
VFRKLASPIPMAIKKSEIYTALWKSCDELRGGMDASQYKDYVLVLLFVKYVSDKAASQKNYVLDVPKGGSFADMVALKGDKSIGDRMNQIIAKLAANNELEGVIDVANWNDTDKLGKGKAMVDRLSNLISIFDDPALDFRSNRAEGDDLLGDAYEYLMRHFATESGKSKGQFYTPAEVSRIIAKVVGVAGATSARQSIHDPTCGSGSLLLKAHDEAKNATGLDLALYGQEMDNATTALARMNLILHDCPTGEIWQDNTLSSPHFTDAAGALRTFDFVVANPPFSTKAWTTGVTLDADPYGRFALGVPPQKNGDYAFLLHILTCLDRTGKGAVILPHGVLFRGNAEAEIRRKLVERGYIKGVIGLPANLFYGTGIPACIVVLDKEGAAGREGIFMVDASKGFIKDGNKNRLRARDIHKIVDAFTRQLEIPRFSRMVPLAEIRDPKHDFNLNLPRYIDAREPEDIQDIHAHLHGGIPDRDIDTLERYWQVFPGVRAALFERADRRGYTQLKVAVGDIKAMIVGHPELMAWSTGAHKLFAQWRAKSAPRLRRIAKGDKPKPLIETLAEALLASFQQAELLDAYDIYQHLMDHWDETMQDDVHLIVSDGWREAAMPRVMVEDRGHKTKDRPDLVVGKKKLKAELLPPALLVARYFGSEQASVEVLEAEAAAMALAREELDEEHGGEDGLLEAARNDKGRLTKSAISARLEEILKQPDAAEERMVLRRYLGLLEKGAVLDAKAKAARDALVAKVFARYGELDEDEIKTLVVEDKWLAAIQAAVDGELDRVSQTLTGRIRELAERYAVPLPIMTAEVALLAARVDEHLQKLGAAWQ